MTYRFRSTNIGDYIQSLATINILKSFSSNLECINDPQLNTLLKTVFPQSQKGSALNCNIKLIVLDRDNMVETANRYRNKTIHLIMNGWFMHSIRNGTERYNWPPPSNICPIFISFHVSKDFLVKNPDSIQYLKKHEPIGCRDMTTLEKCKAAGIKAYYSGCLTLTMDSLHTSNDGSTYVVDTRIGPTTTPNTTVKAGATKSGKTVHHISHSPYTGSNSELFKKAYDLLVRYSRADKIITSRLHCCLPCLAMNKSVTFQSPRGVPFKRVNEWGSKGRFTGLKDIMESPQKRNAIKQKLKSQVSKAIKDALTSS
jgi:hypothetical protein